MRLQFTPTYNTNVNGVSILFMSYSKRMGPNLINLKDFAAVAVNRLADDFAGSPGKCPISPECPRRGVAAKR
jgi:hypothetical protein